MELEDKTVFGSGNHEETCDEILLRPKRKRKLTSYCETKAYNRKSRCVSDSKIGDNSSSLSPTNADDLKKRLKSKGTECSKEKCLPYTIALKSEVELMRACTKSVCDCDETNKCIHQKKQGKKCRGSNSNSPSINVSKQLAVCTASKSSATKLEETNFCAQFMKLEKVNNDDSLDETSDTKDNRRETDRSSSLSKQIMRKRSCKRKHMFGRESVTGGKTGGEKEDLNNFNLIESKSASDMNKVLSSQSNYESLRTSTPVNKRFRRNRSQISSKACSLVTSLTPSSHEDILSERNIPCETTSLPTPVDVLKSGSPELGDASISPPTSLKSSGSYTLTETSPDKSTLADSAGSVTVAADPSIESDSDDEELPVGITPVKLDTSFSPNDVVWVKQKSWSYLPALVHQVYKTNKRLKLAVFKKNGFQDSITMSYAKPDNILLYWHPKWKEIREHALSMSLSLRNQFNESVCEAENFLLNSFKKEEEYVSSKEDDITQSELADDKPDSHNTTDCLNNGNVSGVTTSDSFNSSMLNEKNGDQNSNTEQTMKKGKDDDWSNKGLIRKEKRSQWTKPLTDYMMTNEMKEYLGKIYKGELVSDLSNKFNSKSRQERIKIKQHGFGPIEDEDQINSVLEVYISWLQELDSEPVYTKTNYMLDVWYPEAVVYALKKVKKYSRKRAWAMFERGISRSKAEMKILYPEYICCERKKRSRKTHSFVEIDESKISS